MKTPEEFLNHLGYEDEKTLFDWPTIVWMMDNYARYRELKAMSGWRKEKQQA